MIRFFVFNVTASPEIYAYYHTRSLHVALPSCPETTMLVVSISETDEDLAGRWSLVFEDFALLNAKPAATRLGFTAQLLLYRTTGRFGRGAGEFPDTVVTYLA